MSSSWPEGFSFGVLRRPPTGARAGRAYTGEPLRVRAGHRPTGALSPSRGVTIDRYIVQSLLGRGGMGAVYAAYDPRLDRKIAIKILLHPRTRREQGYPRLLREGQALARLSHAHVVAVHDVGTSDEHFWIAMEFIDGVTLSDWLEERPRGWRDILEMYMQAGEGLRAAHAAGLVHRDFKPDNVMVDREGRARVTDFGLARSSGTSSGDRRREDRDVAESALSLELTRRGAIVGTPKYMAPEQWRGAQADQRSDQFSFCLALWQALYGQAPFSEVMTPALAGVVLSGRPKPANALTRIPRGVHRAMLRGLSFDPGQRWSSMSDLLAALRSASVPRRQQLGSLGAGLLTLAVTAGITVVPSPPRVACTPNEGLVEVCARALDHVDGSTPGLLERLHRAALTWTRAQVSAGLVHAGLVDVLRSPGQETFGGETESVCNAAGETDWLLLRGIFDRADGARRVDREDRSTTAASPSTRRSGDVRGSGEAPALTRARHRAA